MVIDHGELIEISDEDIKDGTVQIPTDVSSIADEVFKNTESLKTIVLPKNIVRLDSETFSSCENLETVVFENKNLKRISNYCFNDCTKLSNIELPKGLTSIGTSAFAGCSYLKKLTIPKKVTRIASSTFSDCISLEEIKLPKNINEIGAYAFSDCRSLKNVIINKKVENIESHAFDGCKSLEKIKLPNSLRALGNCAFEGCRSLEEISIPDNILVLSGGLFKDCQNLKSVKFSKYTTEIGSGVFHNCKSLDNVVIPDSVTEIGESAFQNCQTLKEVKLPKNLSKISDNTFHGCTSLEKVSIPQSLIEIGINAFADCTSLKEIVIPHSVEIVKSGAFDGCTSLSKIEFPESVKRIGKIENSSLAYISKNPFNGNVIFTTEKVDDSLPLSQISINYKFLSNYWDRKEMLFKEQKNPNIADFYNTFLKREPKMIVDDFLNHHNFTFFKQFDIPAEIPVKTNIYRFLYNIGGFNAPRVENGKKVDTAQKMCGFLLEQIKKGKIDFYFIQNHFYDMRTMGENKEFNEFFINNFDRLIKEETNKSGFIARCYNEFDEVQKTNTSNRGSQRQLKATVDKFLNYFASSKFKDVTEKTMPIAKAISPYFSDQQTFEDAVSIELMREKNKVPDHILSTPLKESPGDELYDPFFKVDELTGEILDLRSEILDNFSEIIDNEFSYEWLAKNDPQNLILGKLCSCCSHLEGVGYGIMKASIVNPHVQNLVIRDKSGTIVAKSTLFVAYKHGYGIFNNVEISGKIDAELNPLIYEKYMIGIRKFVEQYNREHPDQPLKQINVGMGNNDLDYEISQHHKMSKHLLEPMNYSYYGKRGQDYEGDSFWKQYTLWEDSSQADEPDESNQKEDGQSQPE